MNELKTTAKLVKHILEVDPQARNSDGRLYVKVLEHIGGIELLTMPIAHVFENQKSLGIPGFETVRRSRQKIQAEFPELAACDKVAAMRCVNEDEFRAYALSKVGVD